jgi:hypothetical protein
MAVIISKTIHNCHGCRHRDHSGAFTPGGPKWICGHPDASEMVTAAKNLRVLTREDYRNVNSQDAAKRAEGDKALKASGPYWKNRVLPHRGERIPGWCPLKHGKGY